MIEVIENHGVRPTNYYYAFAAASFIGCGLLYWASPSLLSTLTKKYKNLPRVQKIDWQTRLVSSVHAVVASSLSAYVLLFDKATIADKLRGVSHTGFMTASISLGYLVHDLVALLWNYKDIGEAVFLVHHTLSVLPFYYVMTGKMYTYLAMLRLFAELSTLNVNIRAMLHDMGLKWSRAYFYNGCSMLATFFISRILAMPYFYYVMWKIQDPPTTTKHLPVILPIAFALDGMNFFWFAKMIRGSLKVVRAKETSSSITPICTDTETCKTALVNDDSVTFDKQHLPELRCSAVEAKAD